MNYTNNTTCSPREQVIRNVLQLIRKQELPPDAEVPAENLLAERFGVARGTVRSGLAELAARGILEKRGRRMHVVSRPAGRGTSLMNRTVILLSSTDKDDAIRKRNSGFMDAIQAGALEELMAQNMHSLWLNGSRLTSGELEELTQIRPGGALFFSSAHPTPEFDAAARQLAESGLPTVASVHKTLFPRVDHVLPDHAEGARLLTAELIQRGCRRVLCYLPANRQEYWVADRFRGYCTAMREAGLEPRPLPENAYWGRHYDDGDAWSESRFREEVRLAAGYLLDEFGPGGNSPDALLTKTDWDVPILAAALHLLGKTPGKDVVIAGYDNKIAFSGWKQFESYTPPLTVDKRNNEIGRCMTGRLLARLNAPADWKPGNVFVRPELIAVS